MTFWSTGQRSNQLSHLAKGGGIQFKQTGPHPHPGTFPPPGGCYHDDHRPQTLEQQWTPGTPQPRPPSLSSQLVLPWVTPISPPPPPPSPSPRQRGSPGPATLWVLLEGARDQQPSGRPAHTQGPRGWFPHIPLPARGRLGLGPTSRVARDLWPPHRGTGALPVLYSPLGPPGPAPPPPAGQTAPERGRLQAGQGAAPGEVPCARPL